MKPQYRGQKLGAGECKPMCGEQSLRDTPIFPLAHRGLVQYSGGVEEDHGTTTGRD